MQFFQHDTAPAFLLHERENVLSKISTDWKQIEKVWAWKYSSIDSERSVETCALLAPPMSPKAILQRTENLFQTPMVLHHIVFVNAPQMLLWAQNRTSGRIVYSAGKSTHLVTLWEGQTLCHELHRLCIDPFEKAKEIIDAACSVSFAHRIQNKAASLIRNLPKYCAADFEQDVPLTLSHLVDTKVISTESYHQELAGFLSFYLELDNFAREHSQLQTLRDRQTSLVRVLENGRLHCLAIANHEGDPSIQSTGRAKHGKRDVTPQDSTNVDSVRASLVRDRAAGVSRWVEPDESRFEGQLRDPGTPIKETAELRDKQVTSRSHLPESSAVVSAKALRKGKCRTMDRRRLARLSIVFDAISNHTQSAPSEEHPLASSGLDLVAGAVGVNERGPDVEDAEAPATEGFDSAVQSETAVRPRASDAVQDSAAGGKAIGSGSTSTATQEADFEDRPMSREPFRSESGREVRRAATTSRAIGGATPAPRTIALGGDHGQSPALAQNRERTNAWVDVWLAASIMIQCREAASIDRKRWSKLEDQSLRTAVLTDSLVAFGSKGAGAHMWDRVALLLSISPTWTRTAAECKARWFDALAPIALSPSTSARRVHLQPTDAIVRSLRESSAAGLQDYASSDATLCSQTADSEQEETATMLQNSCQIRLNAAQSTRMSRTIRKQACLPSSGSKNGDGSKVLGREASVLSIRGQPDCFVFKPMKTASPVSADTFIQGKQQQSGGDLEDLDRRGHTLGHSCQPAVKAAGKDQPQPDANALLRKQAVWIDAPPWARSPSGLLQHTTHKFYKTFFNDQEKPMASRHFSVSGCVRFACLLFVPRRTASVRLKNDERADCGDVGIKLYLGGSCVEDDCLDLAPVLPPRCFVTGLSQGWLRFVRGIVDLEGLARPSSPEYGKQLQAVREHVVAKCLDMLHGLASSSDTSFIQFYLQHGEQLEAGLHAPSCWTEALLDLALVRSSRVRLDVDDDVCVSQRPTTWSVARLTSLAQCAARLREAQGEIFFTDAHNEGDAAFGNLLRHTSCFDSLVSERGVEILLLSPGLAHAFRHHIMDFKGIPVVDIGRVCHRSTVAHHLVERCAVWRANDRMPDDGDGCVLVCTEDATEVVDRMPGGDADVEQRLLQSVPPVDHVADQVVDAPADEEEFILVEVGSVLSGSVSGSTSADENSEECCDSTSVDFSDSA